jgi:hypothetical protein
VQHKNELCLPRPRRLCSPSPGSGVVVGYIVYRDTRRIEVADTLQSQLHGGGSVLSGTTALESGGSEEGEWLLRA